MSTAIAYAQSKRIENLHLTRERDRRRGRELATVLAIVLPIAGAFLLYAGMHVEIVRVGYTRQAQNKLAASLTEENRRLKAELALASSPGRVSQLAERKKLKPPRPGQVQYVQPPAAAAGEEVRP